jgi:hypothetical protein
MHTGESGRVNMSSFSSKYYYCRDNGFGPVEGCIQFYDNSENLDADSDSSNSEGGSSDSKTSLIPSHSQPAFIYTDMLFKSTDGY